MRGIHIYAHVPFCVDPCGYCDFYRGPHQSARENLYVQALLAEIGLRIPGGERIASLYFGGGTPSLLTPDSWSAIFKGLTDRCRFSGDVEISMEANPGTVTPDRAAFWRTLGVNRVSVGVQSLNDRILKFLNRIHTSETALASIRILREAGFHSINADLIYGIPGQHVDDCANAARLLAPEVTHLSAYALTIEAQTPFAKRGVILPDADAAAEQYETIAHVAAEHGLERYEVSNFSRPGHECRHNLNTWNYGSYTGLGPSAVGFNGKRRYKNIPDLFKYAGPLRRGELPAGEEETIDDAGAAFRDRLMLGLRIREGILCSEAEFFRMKTILEKLEISRYFDWVGRRLSLKPSHLLLLDEFLIRIRDRWTSECPIS